MSVRSNRAVQALKRTAQWAVDAAQSAYAEANTALEDAARHMSDATHAAEAVAAQIRDLLQRGAFNVSALQQANICQAVRQTELEEKTQLHTEAAEAADKARQTLLEAKSQLQVYERLLERREELAKRARLQRSLRTADTLGITLKLSEPASSTNFNAQELGHGH
jgi:flagellar biosynthesis chaperone FliJ